MFSGVNPPASKVDGLKKYSPIILEMSGAASYPFDLYSRLGAIVFSLRMGHETKDGALSKKIYPRKEWQKLEASNIRKDDNGYALLTGSASGITAIDIDDVSLPHNEKLMELMNDCNMVARTRKGKHYVFKYEPRIGTKAVSALGLDTRNDGGMILCAPTHHEVDGNVVASYEWEIYPEEDEELATLPEEAVQYLFSLSPLYRNGGDKKTKVSKTEVVSVGSEPKEMEETTDTDSVILQILNSLAPKRWTEYDHWLRIGIICRNEGVPMGVWEKLTKEKYPSYGHGSKRDCADKWKSFVGEAASKLTQATLWKWLKDDDPILFYTLMESRKDFWTLLQNINHNDTAKYFYNMFPDQYLYNEDLGWYCLSASNVWEITEKSVPPFLKRHISDTFQILVADTRKAELARYSKAMEKVPIGNTADKTRVETEHKANLKTINAAYKVFGQSEFCNGVISFLPSYYSKADLEEVMDGNAYLFAFSDKVVELKTGTVRNITPKDYISITTGYPYPAKVDPDVKKEISAFLYGLFENEEAMTYLIRVLASCVFGGNRWERFYILTGKGRNGKGVVDTLVQKTLGNYYIQVKQSTFTKTMEGPDRANSVLVQMRNKRFVMTTEPESDDRLQVGMVKLVSGNDVIEARRQGSYHNYRYRPTFKVFIQTNNIPKLSRIDEAIPTRMEIVSFPFQFVSEPKEAHQRQGNPDVKEIFCKSDAWRDCFIRMLLDVYQEIKDWKDLKSPSVVREANDEYFDDNNPLKSWLRDYYEKTESDADCIKASDFKNSYMADMKVEKINEVSFKQLCDFNKLRSKRVASGMVYLGIKRKSLFAGEE